LNQKIPSSGWCPLSRAW